MLLVPDLLTDGDGRWPALRTLYAALDIRSLYSFPLSVGAVRIGAVDLYSHTVDAMTAVDVAGAVHLACTASTDVLRSALAHSDDDGPFSRREVHQATGMVVAQLGISPDDALLLIRAHAFASAVSVRHTAAEIVARRIELSR